MSDLPDGFVLDDGPPDGFVLDDAPVSRGPSMRYRSRPQELPYAQQMQAGMRRLVSEGRGVPAQMPRQAALAGRAVIEGANALPGLAADAGMDLYNRVTGKTPALALTVPSEGLPTNAVGNLLDKAGLPRPQTGGEKLLSFGVGAMTGAKMPQPNYQPKELPAGFKGYADLSTTEKTFAEARKAGYVVPPSAMNPSTANVAMESVGGKAAIKQAAQIKNQEVTNTLVKRGLGLDPKKEVSPETFKEIRNAGGRVYAEVEKIGGQVAAGQDKQFLDDLVQIGKGSDELAAEFPGANVGKSKEVQDLVDSVMQDNFTTKGAIEYAKELRNQAAGNLNYVNIADPAKRALGYAQRDAATALEDAVMRNLASKGHGDLAKKFNDARVSIAKAHSAEAAFNDATGNFVAAALTSQLKKGKPLSGEFKQVAQFDKAFRQFGGAPGGAALASPGVSKLDAGLTLGSGAAAAMTGAVNPAAALAIPAGTMMARYGLLTSPVQNSLLRAPAAGPVRPEYLTGGLAGLLAQ